MPQYILMFLLIFVLVVCPILGFLNRKSDSVVLAFFQKERINLVAAYFMCLFHGMYSAGEVIEKCLSKVFSIDNKWKD